MASSFTRFLDHTQWCITVGRTPLDEWSACCRDLYLTTHNTHNRQTSMPLVGFEPTISAGERPQTSHWDRHQVWLEFTNRGHSTYWLFKKFLHNISNDFGMFSDVQNTANLNAQVCSSLSKLINAVRTWRNEAKRCNAQLSTHCQYRLQQTWERCTVRIKQMNGMEYISFYRSTIKLIQEYNKIQ